MGFDELWDGFEKIKVRTETGINFTIGFLKYLQKRHEIELKYSRNLQMIHQECFKSDLELGTMQTCWLAIRDETQSISDARQHFCKDLEEIITNVQNTIKDDKRNRALLVAKGDKSVSELSRTEELMKKARAKYVDARKKQDRSQEAVQKAKAAGSSVTKTQKAAEKDEKRADKSDLEYRQSVNNLKVAQDKFFDEEMPSLLREFEQFEENRLKVTRDYFNTLVEKQGPLGPQWVESNDRFLSKVRDVNIRSDLDLFVERNRPDSDQPPPRAQYISYDGSVVQDVNGSTSTNTNTTAPPPTSPIKKTKKEGSSLIPKLPGGKKKKDVPADKEKKTTTANTATPASPTSPTPPTTAPAPITPSPEPAGHHHDSSEGEEKDNNGQNISSTTKVFDPPKPLVTLYAYDATEENEISFAEGETIFLLEKDDSGWWKGRNAKGNEGLFPSNFVVIGEEGNTGPIEIKKDFQALYDYQAEDETELTIKEGEILFVISETDGWYYGTNAQGLGGNFPSNFVGPLTETHKQ